MNEKHVEHYKEIYRTYKVKLQKWTNIISNYDKGVLDIFIDGKLVSTTNNIIPFMSKFNLITGDHNGIIGGIKNTVFNENPFTNREIQYLQYT